MLWVGLGLALVLVTLSALGSAFLLAAGGRPGPPAFFFGILGNGDRDGDGDVGGKVQVQWVDGSWKALIDWVKTTKVRCWCRQYGCRDSSALGVLSVSVCV